MRILVQLLAAAVVANVCECVVTYTNFLKCDFELLNTCQFTQLDTDDLDWTVRDYSYAYLGLSRGASNTRQFAFIETSVKQAPGKAVLRSPKLKPGKYKMQFYNKGSRGASLSVIQVNAEDGVSQTRDLFSRSLVEDFNWNKAIFSFEASTSFWLDIVGTLNAGVKGALAIDQIELDVETELKIQLKVSDMFHCSFDYGSLCGLSQLGRRGYGNFDWRIANGSTPSYNTGPKCGHTNCAASDYYAYIETTGVSSRHEAMLSTPVFESHNGCVKVTFWYHMHGSGLGELTVGYGATLGSSKSPIFSASESKKEWRKREETIYKRSLLVVFRASRGLTSYGDIAIDDITITPCGYKPNPVPIVRISDSLVRSTQNFSFARNSLSPLIQDVNDDFDWSIGSGQTPTSNTGPSQARGCSVTSCVDKYYAFIESSLATAGTTGSRSPNDRALMYTPYRYQASSGCLRVSLWYHTYGTTLGTLKIAHRSQTTWKAVWDKSSSSVDFWRYMQVDINSAEPQQIGFEATCGSGYGDLAIDDITITDCSFSPTAPTIDRKTRYVKKDNMHEFYFYSDGSIFTPGYPNDYPKNLNISWTIMIEPENSIVLMINDFKTEWREDYMRVFDLQYGQRTLLVAYTGTGTKNSNELDTQSYHVQLNFTSTNSLSYKGFTLYWYRRGQNGGSLPQTNNAPNPEYSEPLSTGAIVGIVIGAIAGVGILWCCCCSCKKKKQQANGSATGGHSQATASSTAQSYPVQSYPAQSYPAQPTVTYTAPTAFADYPAPYGQPAASSQVNLSYVPPPGAGAYAVSANDPTASETSWAPPTYSDYVKSPPSDTSAVPSAPPVDNSFPLSVIPPSQPTDNLPAPPSYNSMYGPQP